MREKLDHPGISVLIATYNRADDLRQTLEAFCIVDRENLSAEIVVIDNNSTDNTKEVVESFVDKLPLRYLFQPRPGKNCALNKALDEIELREIVVFTDDDVNPQQDWLKQIIASCRRNPEHAIGGGKTIVAWPGGKEPEWMRYVRHHLGFRDLDLGEQEILFPTCVYPWGTNFWISRRLFDEGLRYDESIGPSPIKPSMWDETALLMLLASKGHRIVYCPDSMVFHRLQQSLATPKGIRRRAYIYGRGRARLMGFARPELRRRHRRLWQLRSIAAIGFGIARLMAAYMSFTNGSRIGRSIEPISDIAYHMELLNMDCCGREGILPEKKNL